MVCGAKNTQKTCKPSHIRILLAGPEHPSLRVETSPRLSLLLFVPPFVSDTSPASNHCCCGKPSWQNRGLGSKLWRPCQGGPERPVAPRQLGPWRLPTYCPPTPSTTLALVPTLHSHSTFTFTCRSTELSPTSLHH